MTTQTDTDYKFKYFVGNVSTSVWRHGKLLGHNVYVSRYKNENGHGYLQLESSGYALGRKYFTEQEWNDFIDDFETDTQFFVRSLRLFGCTSSTFHNDNGEE